MKTMLRLTSLLVLLATAAHAEESLLWKTTSAQSPVVVPAYAGQPSPFPKPEVVAQVSDTTAAEEEQRRLREEALAQAEQAVRAGLKVDLRPLVVGGMVEGTRGARILISNQWVGIGEKIGARQYKSPQALEAIKSLSNYDSAKADELNSRLDAQLAAQPVLALTLQRISSGTLVFGSSRGTQELKFNLNSM